MRIAVCDDSISEQEQVINALRVYDTTDKPECFTSGKELLHAARNDEPFDIVFLDIYMPGEDGIEIARRLREIAPSTGIVFVTSSMDFAIDAFSLDAIHYLVKPITEEGVGEAIRRMNEIAKRKRPIVMLTSGGGDYTVFLDDINYIQSEGHFKEVILLNGRVIRTRMSMEELVEKLGTSFLKLNRSVIVNMDQIEKMAANSCILKDGTQLDFARRERTAIRTAYSDYLFSCLRAQSLRD